MSSSSRPTGGPSGTPSSSAAKPDRLYIGNLSPTIDEYTLIQVLQRYGSITNLDYMFHKSGALKGKPRGYAFVQFSSKDDALKAMVKLHDRLLRGRKLVVTYASSAPSTDLPLASKGRRSEPAKTTTLSLLKSQKRPHSAAAQIAAMEAKLASMQSRKPSGEDYVPGESFRVSPQVASGSASPAPYGRGEEDEMDLEEELGLVEGRKAADDLEREMADVMGGAGSAAGSRVASSLPSRDGTPSTPGTGEARLGSEARADAGETSQKPSHLPAIPRTTPSSATHPALISSTRSSQKSTITQQGLANLPKKPSFL